MKLPGPICFFTGLLPIDLGTLCRNASPLPAPTGVKPPKARNTPQFAYRGLLFPLEHRPVLSYRTGGRRFGARRAGGTRKHAGIDLIAPVGTPIQAVADGTVIQFYLFYLGSYAVEVNHGNFICRYCEVQDPSEQIDMGGKVQRGQVIAKVGSLEGSSRSMLHLEMYCSTASPRKSPLTIKSNPPFQRRKDLIDPTPSMDAATTEKIK